VAERIIKRAIFLKRGRGEGDGTSAGKQRRNKELHVELCVIIHNYIYSVFYSII